MKIWVNTLVRNEDRYLWFAVTSVIDWVEKVLLWDTGSTDNTLKIVKELQRKYIGKIEFEEIGKVDIEEFTNARQAMLAETKSDWVLILDGDEVWWEDSVRQATEIIQQKGKELESIVSSYYNLVGDIFHYQEEKAGMYEIDGRIGHLSIRFMNRRIPGLHAERPHGRQGYFDENGTLIQERDSSKRLFIDKKAYLHFTHLVRSTGKDEVIKRSFKYKYELGIEFPRDFYYPEVFFKPRPSFIPSPWQKMDKNFYLKSLFLTPLRKIKRRFYRSKSGY